MKKALYIITLLMLAACARYPKLPVDQFQKKLAETPDVQLLDVRTPAEFAEGHIPGAINIDWRDEDFLQQAEAQLDKSRPLMVYCRSGRRSESATIALEEAGFDTYDLKNGFLAWTNAGKPVDHSQEVRYTLASGYFFRNDAVIDILPHRITSESELLNYFGRATVMGPGGNPTTIDFEKSMVIPVVMPPTDKNTEIVIEDLLKTSDNQLQLLFHVDRGNESRSYTIIPCKLLVVDAAYRDFDVMFTSPEKY
jgi:rhodanese-related sulfurtransferase